MDKNEFIKKVLPHLGLAEDKYLTYDGEIIAQVGYYDSWLEGCPFEKVGWDK